VRLKIQPNTSWHLVLAAMVLHEHDNEPVDLCKVIKMAAVHDIVELDAGDTFVYDDVGSADQEARERATAVRIFAMLPAEQAEELHALWCESEAKATPEARFASAIDRLLPLLHNIHAKGRTWHEHGVLAAQVRALHAGPREGSEALGEYSMSLIDGAVRDGYLPE
jgi:putative hydrolase of HD superfamily